MRGRILAGCLVAAGLCVVLLFITAFGNLTQGHTDEGRRQLQDAIQRAALACYATEGIYPPNLQYMQDHYGIQVDTSRYTVMYDVFASNLMPDITVLIRE